jgi:streptomycin 6-kinase
VRDLLDRRIAIFAEMLGFDRSRIRGWAYAQAALSAWWTVEDNGDDWQSAIRLAELLEPVGR